MTDIYSYDNLIERIKTSHSEYLIYNPDIFSINPSINFLKFYASFVTPNMGISRDEVDFDSLIALKEREGELAIEIMTKNLSAPYYTSIYRQGLGKMQILQLDKILTEQFEAAINSKNYLSSLALAREIKRVKIPYEFKSLIDEILNLGTDKEKSSAIVSTNTLIPDHCFTICIKYLDSPIYQLREAAFFGLLRIHSEQVGTPLKDKEGKALLRWDMDENGNYYHGYDQFISDDVFKDKELFQKKKVELLNIFNLNQKIYR